MATAQPAPVPLPAASTPNTATAPIPPNTQIIAVTLQPEAKQTSWHDPAVLAPAVAFAVFLFSIWSTYKNLRLSATNTEKQLAAASANLDKQLRAAAANQEKQLQAAAAATESQLKAAQDAADAKMAHDRDEARIHRLMEARRDIYLEILADYQKVQQFIGSMSTAEAKFEERALLSVMSASVNKLWIWGEVDSAFKIREFYTKVNEFYYAALARALTIKKIRDYILALGTMQSTAEAKVKQLDDELRELRDSPDYLLRSATVFLKEDHLNREHREATVESRNLLGHITEFSRTLSGKEGEYLDFLIDRQTELNSQINVVMASARADVGLEGDTSKLEEQTDQMGARVREAIERFRAVHQRDMESVFGTEQDGTG